MTQIQANETTTESTFSMPRIMLHLDGAGIFIASIILYAQLDLAWWIYPLLLLVPDVFAVGYLAGQEVGAFVYNIGHLYIVPIALGIIALLSGWTFGIGIAIIWVGHIAMDRAVGYGMKYASDFKATHLKRV